MKDQLSALIDGEFDVEKHEHIITALKVDSEMKEAWKHYHLIGDVIRGNVHLHHDCSLKIMHALEAEPTVLAVNKQVKETVADIKKRTIKTPMFWSIAASIAAVMFVGLMVFELQLNGAEEMMPIELANSAPLEYLQAHQSMAPSSAAYYMQAASYTEPAQ